MQLFRTIRIIIILKNAFRSFRNNDPLQMGAATAFFAFFALPPIVIILSKVLGILLGNQDRIISGKLFDQLSQVFGRNSANQIEDISENLQEIRLNLFFTIIGILFLIISSTTLFAVIKNSLNQLWNIIAKPAHSKYKFLQDRAIALGIILLSGILFIISLLSDILLSLLRSHLTQFATPYKLIFIGAVNNMVSILILTIWFATLFKYLPDIKIRWKAIWIGAFVTTLLFKLGAFILERLLIEGQAGTIFGASGAIVLILLFVFYSSMIFYFGAAFTKTYAGFAQMGHAPKPDAVLYEITEIE